MKVKRFLLFQYRFYEANGGWEDLTGSFDTAKEAMKFADDAISGLKDENNVVDLNAGKVIWSRNGGDIRGHEDKGWERI